MRLWTCITIVTDVSPSQLSNHKHKEEWEKKMQNKKKLSDAW